MMARPWGAQNETLTLFLSTVEGRKKSIGCKINMFAALLRVSLVFRLGAVDKAGGSGDRISFEDSASQACDFRKLRRILSSDEKVRSSQNEVLSRKKKNTAIDQLPP